MDSLAVQLLDRCTEDVVLCLDMVYAYDQLKKKPSARAMREALMQVSPSAAARGEGHGQHGLGGETCKLGVLKCQGPRGVT